MEKIKDIIFLPEQPKFLENKEFQKCKLKEQNYYNATIHNCTFINCDISESNFSKAKLSNCRFINCNLQFCAMTKIEIQNCEFINCDLWHSNLCHSIIYETLFNNCIIRALFKDLDWQNNTFDENTIVESCGGTICGLNEKIIYELIQSSKRSIDKENKLIVVK